MPSDVSPLVMLLSTTPHRTFPLLYLALILLLLLLPRRIAQDYGTMKAALAAAKKADADADAASGGAGAPATVLEPDGPSDRPPPVPTPSFALVPFGAMLVGTPLGMYVTGTQALGAAAAGASILDKFAAANSVGSLVWSTLAANLLAIGMPLCCCRCGGGRRGAAAWRDELGTTMESWVEGVKDVIEATLILFLAWGLGKVVSDLHTADFVASLLSGHLPVGLLSPASMLISMVVSFGVGSAWGTMGILIPLVAPLAWQLSDRSLDVLLANIGGVMGGAVFGNVASPLADTSVLSAMIARCSMLEHVASQSTYTVVAAAVGLLGAALPVGLGLCPIGLALVVCIGVLVAIPPLAEAGLSHLCTAACRRVAQAWRGPRGAAQQALVEAPAESGFALPINQRQATGEYVPPAPQHRR